MTTPATQTGILDIMAEYAEKAEAMSQALEEFKTSIDKTNAAAYVWGTYSEPLMHGVSAPFEKHAQSVLLKSAWRALYKRLNMDALASAKDKKRFEMLFEKPPELTQDNILEQFGDYYIRPRFHILRGLAEVFTGLDPAYKSHSKVRIGVKGLPKRIIVTGMSSIYGYGSDRVKDIVRALAVYRGDPVPTPQELHDGLQANKIRGLTIKRFRNGNAHIHFSPQDLLDINRGLAEFYGEVLPDAEEAGATKQQSTSVSKDLAYYPTPKAVVDELVSRVLLKGKRVLEPSCGCGRIMQGVKEKGGDVFGIEYDARRAAQCREQGFDVLTANFLETEPVAEYDYVIMNPPFAGRHYIKHVEHALNFLKDGGKLIAVLPATAWYDHGVLKGRWSDLPVASFAESGTNVPTGVLDIWK